MPETKSQAVRGWGKELSVLKWVRTGGYKEAVCSFKGEKVAWVSSRDGIFHCPDEHELVEVIESYLRGMLDARN